MTTKTTDTITITDYALTKLEVRFLENDATAIVEKHKIDGGWETKILIVNEREALAIMRSLQQRYFPFPRRG